MPATAIKPKKVLVIDDGATVLAWVSRVLKGAGYLVATRDQPIGTGAAIVREQPDLVLVDVEMPTLNGDELVLGVKKHEAGQRIPIVLHSSLSATELESRARACGADGYIQKTPNENDFIRQVTALIARAANPALEVKKDDPFAVVLAAISDGNQGLVKLVLTEFPELTLVWVHDDGEAAAALEAGRAFAFVVLSLGAGQRIESLRTLAGTNRATCPPVILFGPPADLPAMQAASRAGVTHYLPLPSPAHAFREAVREVLDSPDPVASGSTQRRRPRLRVPVVLDYVGETTFTCTTWDLCELGAFLCTEHLAKPGYSAVLRLRLPGCANPLEIACHVVHNRPEAVGVYPQGMGVSFDGASPEARAQLAAALTLR